MCNTPKMTDNFMKMVGKNQEKLKMLHATFLEMEKPAGANWEQQAAQSQKSFLGQMREAQKELEKQLKEAHEALEKQQKAVSIPAEQFARVVKHNEEQLQKTLKKASLLETEQTEAKPSDAVWEKHAATMQKDFASQLTKIQKELEKQVKDAQDKLEKQQKGVAKPTNDFVHVAKHHAEKLDKISQKPTSLLETEPAGTNWHQQAARLQREVVLEIEKAQKAVEHHMKVTQEALDKQQKAAAKPVNDFAKVAKQHTEKLQKAMKAK